MRGSLKSTSSLLRLLPLVLPLETCLHAVLITLSAWVFLQVCCTVGFLLVAPLWRWHPKYFSMGSWEIFSLRRNFTPGMEVKMYFTNAINDRAEETVIFQVFVSSTKLTSNLIPSRVSWLICILSFCAAEKPDLLSTEASRYIRKSFSSHWQWLFISQLAIQS